MIIYFRACEKQDTISYVTRFNNFDKTTILKKCWLSIQKSVTPSDTIIIIEDDLSQSTLQFLLNTTSTNNISVVSVDEHSWDNHLHTITLVELLKEQSTKFPDEIHYIVEDDYLHVDNAIHVLNFTLKDWQGFAVSYDYPDRYTNVESTKIILGPDRHWRLITSSTMTALAKGRVWSNFMYELEKAAPTSNDQVFKDIYSKIACISPMPGLSAHMTDKHLSPYIDWKNLWNNLEV